MDANMVRDGFQVFGFIVAILTFIGFTLLNLAVAFGIVDKIEEGHNAFVRNVLYGILAILIAIYFEL